MRMKRRRREEDVRKRFTIARFFGEKGGAETLRRGSVYRIRRIGNNMEHRSGLLSFRKREQGRVNCQLAGVSSGIPRLINETRKNLHLSHEHTRERTHGQGRGWVGGNIARVENTGTDRERERDGETKRTHF